MTIVLLSVYIALLLGLGLFRSFSGSAAVDSGSSFFVNGRRSGAVSVALSIVASCVGGSATMGMAGLAWEIGTPAFWWLGSGACGLVLLVIFLARKIRHSGALTLPEMIESRMGGKTRRLVALIILIAWPSILAAQFLALGKITAALTGFEAQYCMLAGAFLLTLYAAAGGQAAVIRGDVAQFGVIATGLGIALFCLVSLNPTPLLSVPVEFVNSDFPASKLVYYMVVMGGSYVICPMLFGRFLSARTEKAASRGGWLAVIGLTLASVVVVSIGIACQGLLPATTAPDDVLVQALNLLPSWVGPLLLLALFGAVLSSADSCLVTAATVCCNDVLRMPSLKVCRTAVAVIGFAGLGLALSGGSILRFLLMANDVYVCGVVAPVFVALVVRQQSHHGFALLAVALGGIFGLAAAITAEPVYAYIGVSVSATMSVVAVLIGRKVEARLRSMA